MNDPASTLETMLADWGEVAYAELAVLVNATRALAMLHKANHWRTRGNVYYADHLLFDRLSNSVEEDVDSLAERLVGLGDGALVEPSTAASQTDKFLRDAFISTADMEPDGFIAASLAAEVFYLDLVDVVTFSLESKGKLSRGTDNLLAGVSDKHEGLVYLLKQRAT